MLACIYGKFEVMEELLNAGVNVSARDDVSNFLKLNKIIYSLC